MFGCGEVKFLIFLRSLRSWQVQPFANQNGGVDDTLGRSRNDLTLLRVFAPTGVLLLVQTKICSTCWFPKTAGTIKVETAFFTKRA